jgi:hypothetical protein
MAKGVKVWLILPCFLLLAVEGNPQNSVPSVSVPVYLDGRVSGDISLSLPTINTPFTVDPASSATTVTLVNDEYRLGISQNSSSAHTVFHIELQSVSGQPIQLNEMSFQLRFPRDNVDGIWSPTVQALEGQLLAADSATPVIGGAHPNSGVPYIASASASGMNVVSAGVLRQDSDVYFYGYPAKSTNEYVFRMWIPVVRVGSDITEDFYVSDDTTRNWFDAAQDYSDWVDTTNGYQPFPVNPKCYEPYYDTWYWSRDQIDAELYKEAGAVASDVGMGMFIVDSGWDSPPGNLDKGLYGQTGNYSPPLDEFPNINDTLNTFRTDDHLGYVMWLQPFAVGELSKRYPATKNLHVITPAFPSLGEDAAPDVHLDPRTGATQDYLKGLFTELATSYKPDGFWIDFIENIPIFCIANHPHDYGTFGDGLRATLETIRSAILQNVANPVVFNRSTYANLNNKAYANVWQPNDSPGDFDLMRTRALQMRPFSRGVAFASDEMYWPDTADDTSVAKFVMTTVMVGAPTLGGDIVHTSESVRAVVAAWIDFYRKYQSDLNNGQFEPFGTFRVPNHKIENANRTFAYLRNLDVDVLSAQGTQEIYLLNATDFDNIQLNVKPPLTVPYSAKVLDHYLNLQNEISPIKPGPDGTLNLDLLVEQGGAVLLTPINSK